MRRIRRFAAALFGALAIFQLRHWNRDDGEGGRNLTFLAFMYGIMQSARESAERKKGHFMEVHGGEVAADQTEIWELRERLNEAIQSLPSQRRWAFVKTYMEDMSYREAGQEMGLTMETVKSHVKVALKNLRISLSGLR